MFRIPHRRKEEFYCSGGCRKYFLTYLRANMSGNYTIECPGCKHHHYRVIKQGWVSEDRHSDREEMADVIIGLGTTLQNNPWTDDKEFRKMQLKIIEAYRIEGIIQ